MARIEGGRGVKQVRAPSDPGVPSGVISGAFTSGVSQTGEVISAAGKALSGLQEGLFATEKKIQDRKDALSEIKSNTAYKTKVNELNRNLLLGEDITNQNVLTTHGENLAQSSSQILEAHIASGASDESIARLQGSLSKTQSAGTDFIANKTFEASQKIVTDTANDEIARMAAEISADPTKYVEKLNEFSEMMETILPHLDIPGELKTRQFGEETLTLGVIENYMREGNFEDARDFLATPGVAAFVSPKLMRDTLTRIEKAQKAKEEKVFILNGTAFVMRGGKAVQVASVPDDSKAINPVNFVNSKGDIVRIDLNAPNAAKQEAALGPDFARASLVAPSRGALGIQGGTKADLERIRRQTKEVTSNLGAIISHLKQNPDTVGALGFVAGILNQTLAQVSPKFFDDNRAVTEQLVKATRQMALRVTSDETRFSDTDRDRVEALFTGLGAFESAPRALLNAKMLRMFFVRRNILASQELGQNPNVDVTPNEIREAMRTQLMTRTDAKMALELLFPESMGIQQ